MRTSLPPARCLAFSASLICLAGALLVALAACGSARSRTASPPIPTASAGPVTVVTDVPRYRAAEAIGVTLTNPGNTTFYATDNHSECTMLQLQEHIGTTWRDVMPCTTGQAPRVLMISPGLTEPFTLAPGNASDNNNIWDPGIYRIALTVSQKPDGSGPTIQVYSAGFPITAQ